MLGQLAAISLDYPDSHRNTGGERLFSVVVCNQETLRQNRVNLMEDKKKTTFEARGEAVNPEPESPASSPVDMFPHQKQRKCI